MRHFLWSLGFGEWLTRFVDNESKLELQQIQPILKAGGITFNTHAKLNLDDWKILLLAWIRRIHEVQNADYFKYMREIDQLQAGQQLQMQYAMKEFRKCYLERMEAYHEAVDRHHKEEEAMRNEWETQAAIRERFETSQTDYVAERNAEAKKNFEQRLAVMQDKHVVSAIKEEAKNMHVLPLEGADRAFAFIYPANKLPTGAPISGGSVLPHRRAITVNKRRGPGLRT